MADRHMKRGTTSPTIRDMQIKTTMRYHLIPIRMAKINNTRNNRCWQVCGETGTLSALLVGMQTGSATVEDSMEVPQKTKYRITI